MIGTRCGHDSLRGTTRSRTVSVALLAQPCTPWHVCRKRLAGGKPRTETVKVYRPVLELNIDDLICWFIRKIKVSGRLSGK